MKSYYPAPRTSGLDLQVVGSCGVFCLHQSALWLIRTETKISMSNSHFSQRTFPTHTAEDRTDQKLYRHQCQPNCTKESLATDHGGNPATYNPSEVVAFHRSLLLSDWNSKPKKKNCITRSIVLQRTAEGITRQKRGDRNTLITVNQI